MKRLFNFFKIFIAVSILGSFNCLQMFRVKYNLRDVPGPLGSELTGTYQLIPSSSEKKVNYLIGKMNSLEYHTGVMDIIAENGKYSLNITMLKSKFEKETGNTGKEINTLSQFKESVKGGFAYTSKNELLIKEAVFLVESRDYKGEPKPPQEWGDEFDNFGKIDTMDSLIKNRDVRVEKDGDKLVVRISDYGMGEPLIFKNIDTLKSANRKVDKPPIFKGIVFSIQKPNNRIIVTGNDVSKKLKPNSKILIYSNGKEIAKGAVVMVDFTNAKVSIAQGIENINPRDSVFGF